MAILTLGLWPLQASADRLAFTSPAPTVGLGIPTPGMIIQRQTDTGVPITVGPALTITVGSGSTRGQFSGSPDPRGSWSSALGLTIPANASNAPLFYYRDGATGTAVLTTTAPANTPGTLSVTLSPLGVSATSESGQTFWNQVPPGPWCCTAINNLLNVIGLSPAAAHQGSQGIRWVDNENVVPAGGGTSLLFLSAPVGPQLYARAWVRLTSSNALGIVHFMSLGRGGTEYLGLAFHNPGTSFSMGGFTGTGGYYSVTGTGSMPVGAWHLIEIGAEGLGTNSGTARAYLDGLLLASNTGIPNPARLSARLR